ncbi:MAG: bifunctional demethylmenaquinone methyltransferase/2-methoxy-6-polyprenyl-1,4-benzoquinol methylase UbiE [Acidobacteriia bacterium]|nr:bifunctional demethylmenaquinone methyltransferase/2-methoxy-6-polyprenyl-1,4-benzoquinol methylase UbiE [Terriglobia bacterium]
MPISSRANSARNASQVRAMFGAIARRYDFLNHLLSFNIDKRWRRFTVKKIVERLGRRDFSVVDLACGTGDLTLALRAATAGRVVGMDFCHPMLVVGKQKLAHKQLPTCLLSEADALRLPLRDGSFEAVSIAFGFRNFEDYDAGLREMLRILRKDGVAAILEFSRPQAPVFRQLYHFYFTRILPRIGDRLSGVPGPYAYLPDSVGAFPSQEELKRQMEAVGFRDVQYYNLNGGIAALHLGTK